MKFGAIKLKFKNACKSFCISLAILVYSSLYTINYAQAVSSTKEIKIHRSKHTTVPIPKTARSATVILMPTGVSFNHMMGEDTLISLGCTFDTSNTSRISSLIKILKNANIRNANHTDDFLEFEPREGIYLTLDNGTFVKFLFGRAYTDGDHVTGTFSHMPLIKRQFVTGKQSLLHDLFDWAIDTGRPVSKEGGVQQRECEGFMDKLGFYKDMP